MNELIQRILSAMHAAKAARKGGSSVAERGRWQPRWTIEKFHGPVCPENLYATEEIDGNNLLNDGITELWNLVAGTGGTPFSSANARLGVGDSAVAVTAAQTGLQAAVNKAYRSMDSGYPQVGGQTVTFRATFGGNDANYTWNEYTCDNGAGKTLNRKVENHGTKVTGDSWVLTLTITLS